jgi:hypothetical protein
MDDSLKNEVIFHLIEKVINPCMHNFVELGIISRSAFNFSELERQFEALVLNSVICMEFADFKYPEIFKQKNLSADFLAYSISYYEKEKIYLAEYGVEKFYEQKAYEYIFNKFRHYEDLLSEYVKTNVVTEIAKQVFKPFLANHRTIPEAEMKSFEEKLKIAINSSMILNDNNIDSAFQKN